VNSGYSQGFGRVTSGRGNQISDFSGPGVGVGMSLGYRATPGFSVGLTGNYQELNPNAVLQSGTNVRGAAVGFETTFHGMPFQRVDPWVSVGGGYRMLWLVPEGPNNNQMLHGFEIGKLQVGMDMRVSKDVALGPVIGGDVNMFIWKNAEGPSGNREIVDKRLNAFVFAGIQGRFDAGGLRETELKTVAKR